MSAGENQLSTMMPWGHFAVAFLPYLAYRLVGHRDLPSRRATLFLLVASQLPDLIDKPLAWSLHLLPSGRSLAHSLLIAVPLVVLVSVLAARRGRAELGPLFGFGYLTHVVGDVYRALLYTAPDQWAGTYVASLVWPLAPIPASETTAFLYYFLRVSPTRYGQVAVGLVLFGLCFAAPEIRAVLERRRLPGDPADDDVAVATTDHRFDAD
jgi:hypothetical protein